MAKKQIENENTGFIWAVCCQCKEYFSFLDSKGLYNDTIPEDLKCPECERLERNKAKIQKFAEEKGIITSAYLTLKNRSLSIPKYLYYYLHSFDIAKGFYGMGAGVRQGLTWDGIKWLKILTPPHDEQVQIVNYLDKQCYKYEELISKKELFITELEQYKKSLIYEYVTGKKEVA